MLLAAIIRRRVGAVLSEITEDEKRRIISETYAQLAGQSERGWVEEDALVDAIIDRMRAEYPFVFDPPRKG